MRHIRFRLTIKSGAKTLAVVHGLDKDPRDISVDDTEKVIATEQFLERLTGLRFHIESDTVEEETAEKSGARV